MERQAGRMTLGWSVGARLVRWVMSAAITVAAFYLLAGRWQVPWLWATAGVGRSSLSF